MNISYAISGISGSDSSLAVGGVVAIVSVAMVFIILGLIIVLTEVAGNMINKAVKSDEAAPAEETAAPAPAAPAATPLNLSDEDATVAALVASIDYRAETGMNIRVVSVKEVG